MDKEYQDIDNIFKNRDAQKKVDEYESLLKGNVSSYGATTKTASRGKKQVSKNNFRKIAISTLAVAMAITAVVGSKHVEKHSAIDYVDKEIIPEIMMEIDGETEKERTLFIIEELQKRGFSEEQAVYFLKESFGNEFFELAAEALNSGSADGYLKDNGYVYNVVSSAGTTIFQTFADENKFDREVGQDFIETATELKGKGK